jgi:ethanolamine utilization protein EutM
MSDEALGFVETRGLVAAIEACDAMLKAARVRLLARQITNPALITICVEGETAAVKAAMDAGARAAERVGRVAGTLLIPRPAEGIASLAMGLSRESWSPPSTQEAPSHPATDSPSVAVVAPSTAEALSTMPVRALRALARRLPGMPMGGRRISQATREELLAAMTPLLFPRPSAE